MDRKHALALYVTLVSLYALTEEEEERKEKRRGHFICCKIIGCLQI